MIATGLVFVLGALVATLLALLFVPLLWRNAQRLARRDFAATMPATMNEIRAEVDRVRAEAAMTVRRHEMLTQKARERAALERAAVGRLTSEHAELSLLGDQHSSEANFLRGQLAQAQERIGALEEARIRLEEENSALKGAIDQASKASLAVAATSDTIEAAPSEPVSSDPLDPALPAPVLAARSSADGEAAQARVATATAALAALARENRRGEEAPALEARAANGPASVERDLAELRAMASAPRPQDPDARQAENGQIREKIADFAARVIHLTSAREGAGSPLASLPTSGVPATAEGSPPSIAERVRRLTQPKDAPLPAPAPTLDDAVTPATVEGEDDAAGGQTPAVALAPPVTPAPALAAPAKRRRSRVRPRPPSPR